MLNMSRHFRAQSQQPMAKSLSFKKILIPNYSNFFLFYSKKYYTFENSKRLMFSTTLN